MQQLANQKENQELRKTLISELFSSKDGVLHIGGVSVSELTAKYGTPLYIYDAEIIRRQFSKVRQVFDDRVHILYALKANPNIAIARTLLNEGAGLEVASEGELLMGVAAGFEGDNIQFAGPGKSYSDLQRACELEISSVNIESLSEAKRIVEVLESRNLRANVSIRVQQKTSLSGSRMRMSGGSSKFGVPEDQVSEVVKFLVCQERISFRGLHTYAGTQCFDSDAWVGNAERLIKLANELESEGLCDVQQLNFGGGFGVEVFDSDKPFDLASAANGLNELIIADTNRNRKYFIELGRYLTANSGIYLLKVLEHKQNQETQHMIVDGGMNHNAAAAGIGSIVKRNFPIVLANRLNDESEVSYSIGGPLCLPSDQLAENCMLPKVNSGDLLAILVSGAYGLTYSPTLFLSHPVPGEVLVNKGDYSLIRSPGKPEDFLTSQVC